MVGPIVRLTALLGTCISPLWLIWMVAYVCGMADSQQSPCCTVMACCEVLAGIC